MKRSLKIKNVICGIVIAACLGNGYGAEPGTVWLIGAVPLPGLAKPLFGVQHPQDVPADGQRPQFCTPRKNATNQRHYNTVITNITAERDICKNAS